MFAGIAGTRTCTEGLPEGVRTRFDAMVSKDGEVVEFDKPLDISAQTSVKAWLKELESRMRMTLATLLEKALAE